MPGARDHGLERRAGLAADEPAELLDDRALRRLAAERKSRDGDRDKQHRRKREDSEEGYRRAEAHGPVVPPPRQRRLEQPAHDAFRAGQRNGRYRRDTLAAAQFQPCARSP